MPRDMRSEHTNLEVVHPIFLEREFEADSKKKTRTSEFLEF